VVMLSVLSIVQGLVLCKVFRTSRQYHCGHWPFHWK